MIDYAAYYALAGLVVGFLVGMTGVGGGSLMTPILILLFRIHPQAAVGTDLLFAAVTKLAGTFVHGRQRTVDWRIVAMLASGSLPSTILLLCLLHAFGGVPETLSHVMTRVIGLALLLTAPSVFLRQELRVWAQKRKRTLTHKAVIFLTIALGASLGCLVTISSVGSGAIGLAAMIILYPDRQSAQLVGADIAHAVPLTLLAGLGHLWLGSVNLPLLFTLLTGSLPGVVVGGLAIGRVSNRIQQTVLGCILLLIGLKLLFG